MYAFKLCGAHCHIPLDASGITTRLSPASPAGFEYQRCDNAGQFTGIQSVECTSLDRLCLYQIELAVQMPQQLTPLRELIIVMACGFPHLLEIAKISKYRADMVELTSH